MSFPRQYFLVFILVFLPLFVQAQSLVAQDQTYRFTVDLVRRTDADDRVNVELIAPVINKNEIIYRLPKIVPGTYKIYDFGRFISEFKAFDKANKPLPVVRIDTNSWQIGMANQLYKIKYKVDDTFDAPIKENYVFQPAGTSFENEVFFLNTHTFLGYFEGYKKQKYRLNIRKPFGFYGATSLLNKSVTRNADTYEADSYMAIVDSPLLYSLPDTATIQLRDTKVLVAVYSSQGQVYASSIAKELATVLSATEKFLGGTLPVKKYSFLIYLSAKTPPNGMQGALEHSYSSMYYLMETSEEAVARELRDVSAHEFFHIVTPLNLHSEEINDFDYNAPKMSKHLWLYEGVTEYHSLYMQLRNKIVTSKDFFNSMKLKMNVAEQLFDDSLAFTEMSKNVLTEHAEEYSNVYEKGAYLAWCLDLQIRNYSAGKQGLQDVINELSKKYGPNKPFKDDDLFDEITKITHPKIGEFFNRYVASSETPPIKESVAMIGYDFDKEITKKEPSLGKISLEYRTNKEKEVAVSYVGNMNEFGRNMGWQVGDIITEFQGNAVNTETIESVLAKYRTNTKEGDIVKVKVLRINDKGDVKPLTLKAKAQLIETREKFRIAPMMNPSSQQLQVRKAWLSGKIN